MKKRVARILFFKIKPSQEILKIRDGIPLEAEEILTYIKSPRNGLVCYFSSKLDVPSNVVQKKRVARILFFKIRPSQEILKIRDGIPLEAEEILTYIKSPRNGSVCYFSSKLDVPSNVVQKKKVARILLFKIRPSQEILKIPDGTLWSGTDSVFKIRPSQEILKIRDGIPLEAEEILTYIKSPRNGSVCYFSSNLDVPSNVVQNKKVARILFLKIRPSQEILKIRDGTPLEAEEILTYIKKKKRVARILFFKIKPSQEILKIRDGIPLEAEEIMTYIKSPRNGSVCYFSSKLDVPSNVVQKKRVARILFFKIRPSQEILKIRDGIPLEAEEILTYIKSPRNGSVCYFSSKLDVPSNVVQKKKVARILLFKIRPSQEILKIPDGTLWSGTDSVFKIRPSQEILKIRDGIPLEAEEILTYIKSPRNGSKEKSGTDSVFKIRPSQEILKIRDGIPLEAEEILTYIKSPRNGSVCYFSSNLDVPSNVVQNKKVARILFLKIRPSQEILKIRDGTPLEAEEILTYIKKKKRVARILFFKIKPSQEILKIRDGIPLEAEEIMTYIKSPRNGSVCYFSSKLDVPSNVVQKKRVARILFFKIRPSQEILKIRDGIPLEAEEILTYIKSPRNGSICYFSSKLDIPSNVVQKKKVARILLFKIRPSQEILKIPDGTFWSGTDSVFKIRPSQEILKIRDGIPLEAEEILTYIKSPRNGSSGRNYDIHKKPSKRSVCYLYRKFDVPSNVVQKKTVARILFSKIRPSQEILTYIKSPRNGPVCYFSSKLDVPSNVVQKKKVARILLFKIRPSQEILKIRDGTPLEAEEILTYIEKPSKRILQKKRVARILFFKIKPSQEILKIRDGIPLEAEEILTYIKSPRNGSVCYFSSKLDVPSNVVQKKRVARILFFKIRPSQEILKIRDGIPLEAEEILTYIKSPRNGSVCYFSSKLDVPSNVVQKKKVARILLFKIRPSQEILKIPDEEKSGTDSVFKIRPSQEILKIRDGIPLEAEEILTYIKSPRNGSVCYFSSNLDVPSNVVQNKKVARILFLKIRPSQEILKIRDGTPLEAEEILTYIKNVQKKRVARILFFKIKPSQEILKIRDGIPLEAEEIMTYIKSPRNGSVCYFSSKLDVPSNVVQKKRVARILFFKIRPSQEILKIRDGIPLEAEEILTYIKSPRNGSVCYFSSKLDVPSNVVQKKKVARILLFKIRPSQEILKIPDEEKSGTDSVFKIRPSQEILKIRDGIPLEAEEILTYIKSPRNGSVCYFSSNLDVPSNVVQNKKVARILFLKIRPSQEILKIRDGTPLEAEEILTYIKKPSQEILKIRDGTPLEAEEILTYIKKEKSGTDSVFKIRNYDIHKKPSKRSVCYLYRKFDVPSNVVQKKTVARILFSKIRPSQEILTYIKSPRNGSVCYFSSKLDVPSNVVQKKKVARILLFKIRPSQEILKIRDGTPLEAEEILTYIKKPSVQKKRVARILFFKIKPSQEILKIRDGIPLEAEEIMTYIKSPRNGSVCYFSSKLDVPSNVVQKKRVARILFFKIRPSQEILKIRDGIPLEAEEILTYIKSPRNGSVCYFSSNLDVPSNVVQNKKVARILFLKIRPSQEILKIRDGTPLEAEEILTYIKKSSKRIDFGTYSVFKIRPSQEILKIRDGIPLEAEEIMTYIKSPRNGSVCYFSSKLDVPSNVVQKKKVAQILLFKIRPSQEILKIPDEEKSGTDSVFKIRPSQEILKIRDGIPLEAEEILTYIKSPRNGSVCYFSSNLDVPSNVVQNKKVARILFLKIRPSQEILKIRDGTPLESGRNYDIHKKPSKRSVCYLYRKFDVPSNVVQKKTVARILFSKIRPSQEILTYIKSPRNGSVCYFSSNLDVPSNVVQKKRVAQILFFKIRPSQEILKIRDGTPLEAEEISTYIKKVARIMFFKIKPSQEILKIRDGIPLEAEEIMTYIKSPRNGSVCYFSSKLDVPINVVQKKRVARILFFKIRPSQEILKIRDGIPLEAEEILTYIKSPRNGSVCYFSSKLDVPSNVVQKKKVARILLFKIRPSQEILKIRDGTPLEAEEISTYIKKSSKRIDLLLFYGGRNYDIHKKPSKRSVCYLYRKFDVPSNVVQKKTVARILFSKIRPSQEILTYIKSPRNGSVCYFSSNLDVPSNVVQKKRVARILFFKIRPSQEILKIRDGTPLEAEEISTYIKKVARIMFFKIKPSQEILKIRDGIPLEAEEIMTYIKSPRNGSVCYFSSKLDVPSNVVQKKRVARILFFKIRPSQEILKIRDGIPLEAEEILTYIKSPRNGSVCYFSSKLDVPSNVVQKKKVARILLFKIRPSQEILKIRDGTPLEAEEILTYIKKTSKLDIPCNVVQKKRVARILFFKIRPSQEILKIRDGIPLEAEEIMTYIKSPRNGSVCYFSSKLDVPSNVVQKKKVARILLFKIRPSQEILKIHDGTPLEAEEILTYIKKPSKRIDFGTDSVFKIRPSQEILKIRDGIPLEAEEIMTYIKSPRNGSVCYFSSKLDVPSNVVQKKKVARILLFKIRPSQEILKIRDGTPLEAEEILTYIKKPSVQKKRVARILFFKIRPSQEILKIRDGIPLEAEEILTDIKSPRNGSVCYFSSKLDVPSNVVQKKKVARILLFKIRPSQEILKIRDGTPLEAEEILTYIKKTSVQKKRVARILFFKIRPSQEILKIRDGIPLEAEEILTYIKSPRNGSVCYFSSKLDVPSNVVQKKKVARILLFKIRPSQEILKIRDGTPLEAEEILTYIKKTSVQKKRVARILFFKIRPSQEILKIRDGIPLEAEEILTYIKSPRNGSVCYFSSKLDVPSNVVQKKKVARILLFKIRPSQEILKIRDGTPLESGGRNYDIHKKPSKRSVCYLYRKFDVPSNVVQKKTVARILFSKIRPSQEILTYIKSPQNGSVCYFSSKLDVPSNVVQKKKVARILLFKIRPSQEILKIRDGTPLEAEEILTYIKKPSKLDIPCNVVQKKRVARILFFKIRPSQEILKIRDGIPLEAEEILTDIKSPRNGSVCYFSSKLDVPSNVVQKKKVARILLFKIRPSQEILKIRDGTPLEAEEILTYIKKTSVQKKRVARILFFKIRPSQEILKIRDGIPLEAEEILTYIKSPRNGSVCYFSSKLDVPSNVVQKKKVARILLFKIRPSQEILKIRDGTPLEAEEILTYIKKTSVQKKRVARILFFKIRPSQEILKIRDGIPLEAEEILTYIKSPRNGSVCYFSSKLDVPSNVVQKKKVARILLFKIRPSQEILKIRDGTPLEAEEILTYIKKPSKWIDFGGRNYDIHKKPSKRSVCYLYRKFDVPSNVVQKKTVARILFSKIRPSQEILTYIKSPQNGSVCYFSSKLDVPSNVVQKKKVARILLFKIRPSQEILKIRDGTPLEAEEILTYIKKPSTEEKSGTDSVFKIRPSQEILKIRDGIPLEAEEILTYIKSPRNGSVCYFSSNLDVPSNVVQNKKVARILFLKIRPSQEILKIRDGTPLEAEEILTYIKNGTDSVFKIRPSQEILKIRDGTPLEAEEILTYIKSPRNGSICYFSSKLDIPCGRNYDIHKKPSKRSVCYLYRKFDVPSNVVQKKTVARILFSKIRPSQEILTYIKSPRNGSVCYFSSKLDVPSNVVQKKKVARILLFKIRPSQEILKIRDGTPLEAEEILTYIKKPSKLDIPCNVVQKKRVARILFFKIKPSQEILKIRDGIPLEAEEIMTYIKSPRNGSVCYFSSKLDVPSNVVQKKRVARILFFKIRPSQEILKIRDGIPLEAEEILTYIKSPRNGSVCYFSSNLDVPSNVVQNKKVARILFLKIRPSQEILKIRDGTPLEAEEILTYIKNGTYSVFKIRPSQEILKIRDGIPLEAEEIMTYIKSPRNGSVCYFSSKLDVPSNVVQKKKVAQILLFKIRPSQEILKIPDEEKSGTDSVFKIRPSQEILKIRDGIPLEAEEILTYIKSPRNGSVCYFSSNLDVPSNVVQNKKVARILFLKIRPSQEILKIRDGTPLEAEEILTYIKNGGRNYDIHKKPSKRSVCYLYRKFDVPSNVVQKKTVARILFSKIRPSQEILTYIKSPRNGSVCYFSSNLDVPSNVVQKKRVAQILFFKIRPSQEILKIRDGTPLEAEEISTYIKKVARIMFFKIKPSQEILKIRDGIPLEAEEIMTYIKSPRNGSVCYFSSKLDVPINVVQKKRVARILFFKIRPSQEILKIRDGIPLEAEEILTYIKSPRNGSVCYFSSKLDVPSNVVQKKKVARILLFKIRPSQEILKIRDGTPLEAEEISTYIKKSSKRIDLLLFYGGRNYDIHKKPSKRSVCYLYRKFDVPSNVVQKKTVARILFSKIRPSQEILTYIKSPRNGSVCYFSSNLDVPSNVVQKKRVARILFFKIRPSQEILKIRDGTPLEKKRVARIMFFKIKPSQEILKIRDGIPLEAEEIMTYIKSPRNGSVCYFSSKLDVPSNVVQKKRVARILFFKIRPSQEILKIRDGIPLEAEEILTYIKSPRNGSVCYFSSKLDVPSNVVQKKKVARILLFKIRPSQEILKIRDGTPLEAEEILTYIKKTSKLDIPCNVVQKKRVARILFFKIRPSQEILKIRDGIPLEAEEIMTYIKSPRNGSVCYFSSKLDVPSNVVQKKKVARILLFKIRPSQEILKIHDGTPLESGTDSVFKIRPSQEILKIRDGIPLEAEEIMTYIKSPRNGSVCYFSSKLDVPSNVVQKKKVARILLFKIRPSQEILKIRDGTPLEAEEILTYIKKPSVQKKRVARILFFKIRPSQEILKIRDGIPLEAEEILTDIKSPRNGSVCYFSSKLDVPSNVVQKKKVARILLFKIRPSQEILKIRDGTPLEAEEILTYIKKTSVQKKRVARILFFKIRPSQEILKIRDGIPLEAEEILTYIKSPRNGSVCYFSSKLDVPSNVVQKKKVARILLFKIRPSQEILKIRDGTPLEAEEILTYIKKTSVQKKRVARILFFKIRPSQEILKIRDGIPLEAEEILTYIKSPRNGSVCYFSSKLDVPSNVVQKKKVARILLFKIRPSQEILKIRDGTPLESGRNYDIHKKPSKRSVCYLYRKFDVPSNVVQKKTVARILFSKIRPSQEILTYIKSPQNGSVCYFSSKLDVPSNVVQKKKVARILLFKIRPSQEILKIRDGTPLEAEEILTYIKKPSKLDIPCNVVQKKRVARILFFKIRPSQEILKIRDGIPLEAEEILTDIKSPRNGSVCYFSSKLDVPSNVVQKKKVARILLFKIRPSQEILKIRDGTPLEAEEILTYIKKTSVQKKRVARILFFKIRPSQEILKIRDGIPLEAEEILTYIKSPRNGSVCYFSSKLDVPSNVVQKKKVARILLFKIRPSQEILKIRDGTPLEAEEILTYIKKTSKKRVARILFFKIRPSQEILKIRDGIPLEAEEILTYIKSPRNGSVCYFSSKLDVPSNVVQKKKVARILLFKIRPSQEILKIRDGTPLEAEEILTYIKKPSKWIDFGGRNYDIHKKPSKRSVCYLYRKFDVPSNVVQKKTVARILFSKIRPSQEILTYIKSPQNGSVCYFSSKLDVPSNVVQKKKVARILLFKIRPSQEILKIRDGTPLEAEEILTYIKKPSVQKKRVARILFFKIRPSQEILKIRDGIPLEAEEILTDIKSPRNGSVCYFSSKLDVPSNVVQKKKVARILLFKIRPSQEILKIRDGTPLEAEEILTYIKKTSGGRNYDIHKKPSKRSVCYLYRKFDVPSNVVQKKTVARILFSKIRPSQEILTYIKSPRNGSVCYFSSNLDVPSNVVQKKRVARILFFKIRPSQEILKIRDGTPLEKKRVARIMFFKIKPSQEILKIRDGIPLEAEEIMTYIKSPRNGSVCYFSSKLDVPSNVVQKKRVARILFFKIRPSQEILKIRDGIPLEAEEILTYIKSPRNGSVCYFSSKLDVPSNVVQKKKVARILLFKIRPSQEILKIRDGTPLEAEEILTYIKKTSVQKKRVARILFFKIRPSQEILKIRDGIPLEAEEILTYIKSPRNGSVCYFSSKLDVPSNVVQKKKVARILLFKIRPSQEILKIRDGTPLEKKRVARILFFKIRPSQEILKIRDGIPLEAEEIMTYIKSPRNGSVCYFSSKLDVPSNVVQKKKVARILLFKIRPSQEILKIHDGTPLESGRNYDIHKKPSKRSVCYLYRKFDVPSNVVQKKTVARILFSKIRPSQEILTYIKSPRNGSVCYFSSKLDVPSNVVQKKKVARILLFKIRPSQEILKIRDGTPLEAEEILTYIKKPSKLDIPCNVVQKKRVARILFFKIRPSQEILKIRDGIPLEAEEILTDIKSPRNGSVCYFSSKLDVPSNVVQKKKVARILLFKIRPSQEILKIRDGTPLEKKRVARILFFKIRPSQEILKIRDGIPLEAEEIMTYIKSPRNGSVCYFSSKLDVPSNVVQKKKVARILLFKIRPSQEILKIHDGTPLEAEEILTYIKKPSKRIDLPSQEILKIRDGIPLEFDVPSNVVQKKTVARILFSKIRPSQEILTYIKSPRNGSVCYFSSKLDVPSNVVQKKKVARILLFKIRPSQEILKIRDGTPLEIQKKRVARILFFKIRPSQEILKIRDGIPLEAEEILTDIKSPRNGSVCYFSSKLDVPSNVVQKKKVARILLFKIRPSQEILKIRDGTPLEAEEILTYIKRLRNGSVCYFSSNLDVPSNIVQKKIVARILFFKIRPSQEILKIPDVQKKRVARILFFKIRPSQEILKIRDGIPLEAEEILTYIKSPRNGSVCYFSSKLDVPSNVVQKKKVARILLFKIRPSQEILKIRDGTPLEKKRVARILFFKIRPSQEILKIRDGIPLEAEEILTYIKSPRNGSVCYFSSKLDVPSNVVQKKKVARILLFKIRPSQEILKIRDGTPLEAEEILTYIKKPSKRIDFGGRNYDIHKKPSKRSVCYLYRKFDVPSNVVQKKTVARILFSKIRPSQEILTYIKSPRNGSVCYFSSKLDVPSNVVQKKKVARILLFKIRPSQEILKIRDGTPLEAEEILTYIKKPSKLDIPCNVVQKKRVARILFFKIRPSQEILKIRDGIPLEAEEILTDIKSPRNGSVCYFSSKLDVPSNVVQKKKVARILLFKIRPSQEILKIRDGTPLEAEEILTYIKKTSGGRNYDIHKKPSKRSVCYLYRKFDVPSNVVQKKTVARILFSKIRPSQEILTYIKSPRNGSVCYFSSNLDVPSNVVQKKRVARILFFKIRPSQEILKIRDGTPLEAEEISTYIKKVARIMFFKIKPSQEILKIRDGIPLEAEEIMTYIKSPRNGSVCYFSSKLDVPSNVVQKKRVARILFFKIRPSQEILKIRDGIPLEAEEILTYIKSPRNGSVCYFSSKLDVPSNVVQKKKVARILLFKIRPSQEILKIRDGTPLEAEEILTYIKKTSKKRVARILFFKIRPSQEILKIRDGIPLEAEEILTYIKSPRNGSVCYFSSKLDVPSNVVQKKKVARILLFKIRPSQEILKIRDGTPLEAEPSQEILKIRDGTPLEAEEILTYIKKPSKRSVYVPSNVVQKKRVARILFFKIRPSQEILKIRDGIPLEAEEILTYIKSPRNGSVCYFSSKLDVPSNVVQKKRVARILFSKIRPSQEILKIRDGIPLEAEEILTYIKSPRNGSVCYFSSKLDVPSNVVQKKKVARILLFKIRPSQEILKIRDDTPLEAEEILTYIKKPS
ncbi:hypothetical protein OROHE_004034 [Orobanche hederae]